MLIVYYPSGQSVYYYFRLFTGIIIAGDFNKLNLSRLCNRFGLKKAVSSSTRGKNSLDQVLTNMANLYSAAQHLPPTSMSTLKPKNYQQDTVCVKKSQTLQTRKPAGVKQKSCSPKLGYSFSILFIRIECSFQQHSADACHSFL